MKTTRFLACALLGSASIVVAAEPPLITDRPDQSDTPFVVPPGLFQIEAGGFYTSRDLAGEKLTTTTFPSALLRFGVSETFELRLTVPGIGVAKTETGGFETKQDGLLDSALGFKFVIAEEEGVFPQTAFVGTLSLPVGADALSSERVDPGFRLAFANSLTDRIGLTYNAGMFWVTERDSTGALDTRSFVEWTLTAGFAVGPKLSAFGELFGATSASAESRALNSTGGGVTYPVSPRIQIDGRLTLGLSRTAPDWALGAGVSYRFPGADGR